MVAYVIAARAHEARLMEEIATANDVAAMPLTQTHPQGDADVHKTQNWFTRHLFVQGFPWFMR